MKNVAAAFSRNFIMLRKNATQKSKKSSGEDAYDYGNTPDDTDSLTHISNSVQSNRSMSVEGTDNETKMNKWLERKLQNSKRNTLDDENNMELLKQIRK
jgi:hypothetical protein